MVAEERWGLGRQNKPPPLAHASLPSILCLGTYSIPCALIPACRGGVTGGSRGVCSFPRGTMRSCVVGQGVGVVKKGALESAR